MRVMINAIVFAVPSAAIAVPLWLNLQWDLPVSLALTSVSLAWLFCAFLVVLTISTGKTDQRSKDVALGRGVIESIDLDSEDSVRIDLFVGNVRAQFTALKSVVGRLAPREWVIFAYLGQTQRIIRIAAINVSSPGRIILESEQEIEASTGPAERTSQRFLSRSDLYEQALFATIFQGGWGGLATTIIAGAVWGWGWPGVVSFGVLTGIWGILIFVVMDVQGNYDSIANMDLDIGYVHEAKTWEQPVADNAEVTNQTIVLGESPPPNSLINRTHGTYGRVFPVHRGNLVILSTDHNGRISNLAVFSDSWVEPTEEVRQRLVPPEIHKISSADDDARREQQFSGLDGAKSSRYSAVWNSDELRPVAISQDGSRIIAAYGSGGICMLDGDGEVIWKYHHSPDCYIANLTATPDGGKVVATIEYEPGVFMVDGDGSLLWDVETGEDVVWNLAIAPDGDRVAATGDAVYMLDDNGAALWRYPADPDDPDDIEFGISIAMSKSASRIAVWGWDGSVHMLGGDGELIWKAEAQGGLRYLATAEDGGRVFLMPTERGSLDVLDANGSLIWNYDGIDGRIRLAMNQDGTRIAVVSYEDGQVNVLTGDGELLWRYGPVDWVRSVAMSQDGNCVAVVSEVDGHLYVMDGRGEPLWKYTNSAFATTVMSHDGSVIAASHWQGDSYIFREGADGQGLLDSSGRGSEIPSVESKLRCLIGIHHGNWTYQTRTACDQTLVCPEHGPTRHRVHHRRDPWIDRCRRCRNLGL